MSEGKERVHPPEQADLLELARDWITLWQSELSALATDREAQEAWQTLISLWASAAGALFASAPLGAPAGAGERADGRAGSAATAGAAAAAAAPDPRDAEIERLHGRIETLERRLADVERRGQPVGANARRGARIRGGNRPAQP